MFGLIAVTAAIFAPAAAAAPPPRWQVDTGKTCAITLPAADPAKDIGLKIAVSAGEKEVFVSFENPRWATSPVEHSEQVKLSLEPGGVVSPADIWFSSDMAEGSMPSLGLSIAGSDFLTALTAARALAATEDGRTIARLPFGDPTEAVAALRACREAEQRRWGIDPALWATLRSTPVLIGGPGASITTADFTIPGKVTVRLDVDAEGKPTNCAVVESSSNDSLDQTTCRLLLTRAHFHPALDDNGKAAAAPFILPIDWRD